MKVKKKKKFIASALVAHLFNNICEAPGTKVVTEKLNINKILNWLKIQCSVLVCSSEPGRIIPCTLEDTTWSAVRALTYRPQPSLSKNWTAYFHLSRHSSRLSNFCLASAPHKNAPSTSTNELLILKLVGMFVGSPSYWLPWPAWPLTSSPCWNAPFRWFLW